MELRDYQQTAISEIYAAWAEGKQNVLYVAPCRSGKTVVMSKAIVDNIGASIVLAHRFELIQQMSLTLARRGVYHEIIGSPALARACSEEHLAIIGNDFISPHANCYVASAQTLMRCDVEPWMDEVTLWITDEGHHYHVDNSWTKALAHFVNARGLSVTATPIGSGGKGLGRHADGLIDVMMLGPSSRELIKRGYLTDYKIYAPESDIDLSNVPVSASGDFSPKPLAAAVHKSSRIVGDIVQSYRKFASGKLGMTFAVDIESATEISNAYNSAGVPSAVVSGQTPQALRRQLQQRHQARELLQLVSVDLYGEGIDIQSLEVVSFGRPTQSLGLYIQQFWRPGNPDSNKPYFTVIDHVSNVRRHGLPDAPRIWSLDRKERSRRSSPNYVIPVTTCIKCLAVYERVHKQCPYCRHISIPMGRGTPDLVDGDLAEMSEELLARLRGEIAEMESCLLPDGATDALINSKRKQHRERMNAQSLLRSLMSQWGEWRTVEGDDVSTQQRRFFHQMGVDVMSAQSLGSADVIKLGAKIMQVFREANVDFKIHGIGGYKYENSLAHPLMDVKIHVDN